MVQKPDGSLYGVTILGGANQFDGVLYKIDRAGTFSVVHHFSDAPDGAIPGRLILGSDGNIYGLTGSGGAILESGTVYQVDSADNYSVLHSFNSQVDGAGPVFLMEASDGFFYGTAATSGNPNPACPNHKAQGTFFRMDSTGNVTPLHTFCETTDGSIPNGVVEVSPGQFYGTCLEDGPLQAETGNGTLWKSDASGNVDLVRVFGTHTVINSEPNEPLGLVLASDGLLYGVSNGGGAFSNGAIYRSDLNGNVTTLHSFNDLGTSGADPDANFTLGHDGFFYGTASTGGLPVGNPSRSGVVYRADTAGNVWVLHSYRGSDGAAPNAIPLLGRPNNTVYATAVIGGSQQSGTVGSLSLSQNLPVRALTFSPNPVKGGQSTTATLTLSAPAPAGGQVVKLFASNSASVPSSVTVPAGQTKVTFSIRTLKVSANLDVFITANINSEGLTSRLTLTP